MYNKEIKYNKDKMINNLQFKERKLFSLSYM